MLIAVESRELKNVYRITVNFKLIYRQIDIGIRENAMFIFKAFSSKQKTTLLKG